MPETSATPSETPWYALQVRHPSEKKTDALLKRKGITTFLPLLREVHRWSDRRKRVDVPLFPGYDFVQLQLSPISRKRLLETPGVIGFAGPQQQVTPVPAVQVESLQTLLRANVDCALQPFLRAGQRVRIRNGALVGLVGILLENGKKLVISIDSIERSVSVAIEGYDLELV